MISVSEKKFYDLKSEGYSFPIEYKVKIKAIDPIAIYSALKGKYKSIFEVGLNEKNSERISYVGEEPYMIIKNYEENIIEENINGEEKVGKGNIFDYLKEKLNRKYDPLNTKLSFCGGALGYLSYDTVKLNEKIKSENKDELKLPDSCLLFYKTLLCYNHKEEEFSIIYNVFSEDSESYIHVVEKIHCILEKIKNLTTPSKVIEMKSKVEYSSNFLKEEYEQVVEKAKEYIRKGDIFQVVPSQRFKFKKRRDSFDSFRVLREKNPSPYLFHIDFEDFQIAGSSPETLVTVKDSRVYTNPIAGTIKRGKTKEEDEENKIALLGDEKEVAEHVMLVDLGRNDIGKISDFGTVKIDKFMEVHKYSHVMHIVSMVSGRLKKDFTAVDALKSCLPVGTVSGAPKIRAMEIIEELENVKRGIYAGGIGYFSFNGDMDSCIAIRTAVFKEDYAYVQAGGGVVYDSNPEMEYMESVNKAMALKEVL